MEFTMDYVLRQHVYTGSMLNLFIATIIVTVPLAWLLHRFTRVRNSA
jgi:peptidoglycan/LPS O-acetylase OafA/YrhL